MHIIKKVRKVAFGPKRRLPYSKMKIKYNNVLLYWMSKVKYIQERKVNKRVIENRRLLAEIKEREVIIEAKKYLVVAKKEQEEFKLRAKEYIEQELLDLHTLEISGDMTEIKRYKKKVLKGIKRMIEKIEYFNIYLKMQRKELNQN